MKSTFDRIIWLGNPPLNEARITLTRDLLQLLRYEDAMSREWNHTDGQRSLVLGNVEDWQNTPELWPPADGHQIWVGLFTENVFSSEKVLESFIKNQVSFFWNEKKSVLQLQELINDLLRS